MEKLEYSVYNEKNEWLCSYGIGWSLGEIFKSSAKADHVVLKQNYKELVIFNRKDFVGIA